MNTRYCIIWIALYFAWNTCQYLQAQPLWGTYQPLSGNIPLERIQLITDRDLYIAGETLWFIAYYRILDADQNYALSQVLYVELFNSSKESMIREKFSITNGTASGCLTLPPEIATDLYLLRAYTNYQRNFPPESYSMACIRIVNPDLPYLSKNSKKSDNNYIEAENATPIPPDGLTGLAPWIERTPDGLVYHLENELLTGNHEASALLLCIKSSELATCSEIPIPPLEIPATIPIPYQHLHPGINFLVLKQGTERILHVSPVFIPGPNQQEITVEPVQSTFGRREWVQVSLKPDPGTNESMQLTVSVVKKGTSGTSAYTGLLNTFSDHPYLLDSYALSKMAGEPGFIEKADQCMLGYAPHVNNHDFYKKLSYSGQSGFSFLPEIRDVSISGQVVMDNSNIPVSGVPVVLSVIDQSQFHQVTSNNQGLFVFPLNNLTGIQNLFLCTESGSAKESEIRIHHDFSRDYPDPLALQPMIDSSLRNLLEDMWINTQLSHLMSRPAKPDQQKPNHRIIFTDRTLKVVLSDFIELSNLYEVFWEIVPFVQVRKKKDHYTLQVINERMEVFEDPLILLDDVPVRSVDELMKIPPVLVDRIEVINEPYIHGDFVLNGVVMVYTKTENFAGVRFPDGSVFLDYQTIMPTAKFPAMDYVDEQKRESRRPDFRNLLYWNPELILSGQPDTVSFFTSDHTGDYEVIVRGFTAEGVPCFGTASFKVLPE